MRTELRLVQGVMIIETEDATEDRTNVKTESHMVCNFYDILNLQVIAAEGEQKASKALRDASLVMAESSSALQLRYLQVHILFHIFFSIFNFNNDLTICFCILINNISFHPDIKLHLSREEFDDYLPTSNRLDTSLS